MQPLSTLWKVGMSIVLILLMRFAVYPLAKIYVADFGLPGTLIACVLIYWGASVMQRRDHRGSPRHDQ